MARGRGEREFDVERTWDYENGFYLTAPVGRLAKLFQQYEVFRRIADVPGIVVELGVYKGASLARWLAFRDVLEDDDEPREVVAFDAFGAFPTSRVEAAEDLDFVGRFEREGGDGFTSEQVASYLDGKGHGAYTLVPGDVRETLPAYLAAHPDRRVALAHLDLDVYEPTLESLVALTASLAAGALVVLDDYGAVDGATRAADEWTSTHGLEVEHLSLAPRPCVVRWPG